MAEHVGQQLGNYRLIQLLGQGNFSEVYLGEHIHRIISIFRGKKNQPSK
jgi:serine/threonine protein kinase